VDDSTPPSRTAAFVLALILIVGAGVRLWGIQFGLPNTSVHPDESATVGIAAGMLFAGLNPHFFHWPSLEFYAVATIYRLGWQVGKYRGLFRHKWQIQEAMAANPALFLMVPRLLSVIAGVATIWCAYRFTRAAFDRATALVAAFFAAIAFLHVRDSHFGVPDVPATFLAMAAMLPLGRALRDPLTRKHWTWSGILIGLAASTKYNAGIVASVAAVVAAIVWIDAKGEDTAARRRAAGRGLTRCAIVSVLAFLAGTPFAVLDFPNFIEGLRFNSEHLMAGHGPMLGRGWWYHLTFSLRYGLGLPLLIASIAGIVLLFVRSWRLAALVCTFPLVYYLIVGRGLTVFVRYVTPMVPFLCITAAVAVVAMMRAIARRWPAAAPAMPAATAAVAILVALPSIQSVIGFNTLASRDDTRLVAAAWLDAHRQPADWVDEEAPAMLHPTWGRKPGVNVSHFNAGRGGFFSEAEPDKAVTPDWIAVGSTPVPLYGPSEADMRAVMAGSYELAATFSASSGPEPAEIFDRQDHFFFPYTDFSQRLRSGPDIRIYRRVK